MNEKIPVKIEGNWKIYFPKIWYNIYSNSWKCEYTTENMNDLLISRESDSIESIIRDVYNYIHLKWISSNYDLTYNFEKNGKI
jgi:hypothetical protein